MMPRAAAELSDRGAGRCALTGALTLETAPWVWQQLQAGALLQDARSADLSGVTDADSAGLALLLGWRASCLAAGSDLAFEHLPARVVALARLTDAEGLLTARSG